MEHYVGFYGCFVIKHSLLETAYFKTTEQYSRYTPSLNQSTEIIELIKKACNKKLQAFLTYSFFDN